MQKITREDTDSFIEALEEMIDARDDMWEREQHHNWRQQEEIKKSRYLPAKERVGTFLNTLVNLASEK